MKEKQIKLIMYYYNYYYYNVHYLHQIFQSYVVKKKINKSFRIINF